jgi:hypothetical protein
MPLAACRVSVTISFGAVMSPTCIPSRTPEGDRARCTVCGHESTIEPSEFPTRDAPCPDCGALLWIDATNRHSTFRTQRLDLIGEMQAVINRWTPKTGSLLYRVALDQTTPPVPKPRPSWRLQQVTSHAELIGLEQLFSG